MKHLRLFALFVFMLLALNQVTYSQSTKKNIALSTAQLETLLKASSTAVLQYEERRESPWLNAPQHSSGTLSLEGPVLIKKTTSPHQEIWRLHPEYIEATQPLSHTEAWSEQTSQILYSQAPGIGVLANALRAIVMGNLGILSEHFVLEITGTDRGWYLSLTPKRAEDRRALSHIEFKGARSGIETIVVTEPQGEKTTTTLLRPLS